MWHLATYHQHWSYYHLLPLLLLLLLALLMMMVMMMMMLLKLARQSGHYHTHDTTVWSSSCWEDYGPISIGKRERITYINESYDDTTLAMYLLVLVLCLCITPTFFAESPVMPFISSNKSSKAGTSLVSMIRWARLLKDDDDVEVAIRSSVVLVQLNCWWAKGVVIIHYER